MGFILKKHKTHPNTNPVIIAADKGGLLYKGAHFISFSLLCFEGTSEELENVLYKLVRMISKVVRLHCKDNASTSTMLCKSYTNLAIRHDVSLSLFYN